MRGGHRGLPCHMLTISFFPHLLLLNAILAVCSTLFRQQIYYPTLLTLVGSQNQVVRLGKYFHWSSFSITVPVGGHWQGWFPLSRSPWKPPCCASYLCRAPTNLSWHQFPSSSIADEFNVGFSKLHTLGWLKTLTYNFMYILVMIFNIILWSCYYASFDLRLIIIVTFSSPRSGLIIQ